MEEGMPENEAEKGKISFNPVVFTLNASPDGQPHLLGSHCSACGAFFFPQQTLCTQCFTEGSLKEHPLKNQGTLYSFTIVERESLAPKGFKVPYAYGYVDLPEGVRVLAKIVGWTLETLKMGAPVELITEELRESPSGQKVVAFYFRII
jgi:uncharacterized OB-fold protein